MLVFFVSQYAVLSLVRLVVVVNPEIMPGRRLDWTCVCAVPGVEGNL